MLMLPGFKKGSRPSAVRVMKHWSPGGLVEIQPFHTLSDWGRVNGSPGRPCEVWCSAQENLCPTIHG